MVLVNGILPTARTFVQRLQETEPRYDLSFELQVQFVQNQVDYYCVRSVV